MRGILLVLKFCNGQAWARTISESLADSHIIAEKGSEYHWYKKSQRLLPAGITVGFALEWTAQAVFYYVKALFLSNYAESGDAIVQNSRFFVKKLYITQS